MHLLVRLYLGLIPSISSCGGLKPPPNLPPNPGGGNGGNGGGGGGGLLLLLFPGGGLVLLLPKVPNPLIGFAPTVPKCGKYPPPVFTLLVALLCEPLPPAVALVVPVG